MGYYKKIEGHICYLSPINMEDAPTYTKWLNDLDVIKNLVIATQNIGLELEVEKLRKLSQQHTYGIVDKKTNELVGNCGLIDWDMLNRCTEVGIFIGNKKFWDRGYGTEALNLLMWYAFNYLNMKNIMLKVYSFNERGIKCYTKCGFKEIGRRRKSVIRNMQEYDAIYMDILADEFTYKLP